MSHNGGVWRRRGKERMREPLSSTTGHVVLASGTPDQWRSVDEAGWTSLLGDLARAAVAEGLAAVTLVPLTGEENWRFAVSDVIDGVIMRIESRHDGRYTIVEALRTWPAGQRLTEESLGRAVRGEVGEPDLVVVCDSDGLLPSTLVWELAYAELVYLPVTWSGLDGEVLRRAMGDFRVRQRRFGGVEESPAL